MLNIFWIYSDHFLDSVITSEDLVLWVLFSIQCTVCMKNGSYNFFLQLCDNFVTEKVFRNFSKWAANGVISIYFRLFKYARHYPNTWKFRCYFKIFCFYWVVLKIVLEVWFLTWTTTYSWWICLKTFFQLWESFAAESSFSSFLGSKIFNVKIKDPIELVFTSIPVFILYCHPHNTRGDN